MFLASPAWPRLHFQSDFSSARHGLHARLAPASVALALALSGPVASADEPPATASPAVAGPAESAAPPKLSYVIGLSANEVPTYSGSGTRSLRLRPLWALRYGNLRLSTSGARAVMDFGGDPVSGSGASLQVADTGLWKFGAALRLDGGRSESDDPALAGLPEIRRTLRGRLYADRRLGEHATAGFGFSHDLLGRGGGGIASFGLGYGGRIFESVGWSAGVGASVANGVYMQTHYGVSPAAAVRSAYPSFSAGAGLLDVSVGVGATTALSSHWVVFAGAGAGRLLGDAADSPLTRSATSWRLSAGIAYRCCRP